MDFISFISFLASLASLILAVIAIWLALYHKKESDITNGQTRDILTDIKTDAKIISAVALPELKAYGDSMREFVLHTKKSESSNRNNNSNNNSDNEYLTAISNIQAQLNELNSESDIRKIKTGINTVSNRLKKSQKTLKESEYKGIYIEISDDMSVSTSNKNETWNDLLSFVFSMSKDLSRDNYIKAWKLINKKNGEIIPKKYISNTSTTFSDLKLNDGDKIKLEREQVI